MFHTYSERADRTDAGVERSEKNIGFVKFMEYNIPVYEVNDPRYDNILKETTWNKYTTCCFYISWNGEVIFPNSFNPKYTYNQSHSCYSLEIVNLKDYISSSNNVPEHIARKILLEATKKAQESKATKLIQEANQKIENQTKLSAGLELTNWYYLNSQYHKWLQLSNPGTKHCQIRLKIIQRTRSGSKKREIYFDNADQINTECLKWYLVMQFCEQHAFFQPAEDYGYSVWNSKVGFRRINEVTQNDLKIASEKTEAEELKELLIKKRTDGLTKEELIKMQELGRKIYGWKSN
jgi:hypothetical protein